MALRFLNSGYFAGKVGIGTESPGAKLHVGTRGTAGALTIPATDGILFDFHNDGPPYTRHAAIISQAGDASESVIDFWTKEASGTNSKKMTLRGNGNVGIGTISPAAGLQVALGGTTIPAAGASTASAVFGNSTSDDNYGVAIGANSSGVGYISSQRTDGTATTYNLAIQPNGGNVGIGVTSSINGTLTLPNSGIISFHDANGDARNSLQFVSGELKHGAAGAGLTTQTFFTNGSEKMRITSAGNVGIGTDSPLGRLQVNEYTVASQGNQNIHGELSVFTNSGDESLFLGIKNAAYPNRGWSFNPVTNGVNSNLQFKEHGSTSVRMTIESGGSVGINTTSPDFKLDVDGTFGVSDLPFNTDSVSVLVADETIGTELITNGEFATATDWTLQNAGSTISGGKLNQVSVPNGQNVYQTTGIVVGNTYKVVMTISGYSSGGVRALLGSTGATATISANGTFLVEGIAAGNTTFYIQAIGTTTLSVDNVSVKQVTSASNQIQKRELGTGAFGPTPVGAYLPLAAGSGSPLTGDLYIEEDSLYLLNASNNYWRVQNNSSGKLTFKQGTTQRGIWSSGELQLANDLIVDGSVGIGTTSVTAAKLVVSSNTGPQLLIKCPSGGSSAAQILFEHNSGGTQNASITFDQSSQNTLTIATGYQSPTDLNRINISPAGNVGLTVRGGTGGSGLGQPLVGIGTTTPTEKLDVAGNIKIQAALLSNQENTDIDTGAETVAEVSMADYTAAFFDFVIKKGTNVRSGTVYACHDGGSPPVVEFTETSTQDLGDTSDVVLSVDKTGSGGGSKMRLLATVTSDDWSVKSLIRAI
jgi:hypothetical protein